MTATPEQQDALARAWGYQQEWAERGDEDSQCFLDLRARVEALEAGATCPYIVTSDEGTSHCKLAESNSQPTPNDCQIRSSDHIGDINKMVNSSAGLTSSLVERVAYVITGDDDGPINWKPEARAAIREVAAWLHSTHFWEAADVLEQEAEL